MHAIFHVQLHSGWVSNITKAKSKQKFHCVIWGSHNDGDIYGDIVGSNAVQIFWNNILLPSSTLKMETV
jgi:hypothetical protein